MSGNANDCGESLPVSVARHLDQLCNRHEDALRTGRRPSLRQSLDEIDEPARPALLRELLRLELEYRGRAGERPAPEAYLAQFPEQAELIHAAFRELSPAAPSGEAACDPGTLDGPGRQPTQRAALP